MAQAPLCVPPEEPWVPDSEADFQAYADLVAADFDQYFLAQVHLAKANGFSVIQNSCAKLLYR